MRRFSVIIFCIFCLSLPPSCSSQKTIFSSIWVKDRSIPLFIAMPSNSLVFDNVAYLVYESLHRQYSRIGYHLVTQETQGYSLQTTIKKLDPNIKFVSPNIVLLHYYVKAEIECVLCDFNQTIVAKKTFSFSSLISKPRNPIINDDFIDFAYRRLFERLAPKIEYFFRSHLLNTFK